MPLTKIATRNRPGVPPQTAGDYVALVWATGFFSGFSPVAPGTAGSAVMAGLYYTGGKLGVFQPFALDTLMWLLLACVVIAYSGVWAAERAERFFAAKDPGAVVVDEFAGQLITYLFLPLVPQLANLPWMFEAWAISGFFLFRLFDVIKPYPAQHFEVLRGGLGVMADDIVAGIQASLVLLLLAKGLTIWLDLTP
ncbi:MAG: phosphatidylglycerophosphatase A family protein [Acidobacteriota bacterium]